MEIGSEYWEYNKKLNCNNKNFWNIGKDIQFALSGRTALYYVLKNILIKEKISKAYLPSYCCDSMIQPFKDLEIKVEFYDVYYDDELKYNIDLNNDCEIFFAMNYFGYSQSNMDNFIKAFSDKGKIIIEDITHSIFSKKRNSEYSHYLIGSLRKWFPIASGGIAVNVNEDFEAKLNDDINNEMVSLKKEAMKNKRKYIEESNVNKDMFLKQYSESNKILEEDYKNYKMDEESLEIIMKIDLEEIKKVRKNNAKIIYETLKNNYKISFLYKNYNKEDVLLFVPIILDTQLRDNLRKYMIENSVYLPIHWPTSKNQNSIYNCELSLICDQRYSEEDIKKYTYEILRFVENYN